MKEQLNVRVDKDVKTSIIDGAKTKSRSVSNHVEIILKKHLSKQEVKSNSKKEYGS